MTPTEAFDLVDFKRSRFADINAKTEAIFAKGFTFSGVAVRMNTRSLIFYQSLSDLGGALSTTLVPAADDFDEPLTVNLLNVGAFTGAVKTWLRQMYADEAVLKAAIRAAATREAVEAVVDTRAL